MPNPSLPDDFWKECRHAELHLSTVPGFPSHISVEESELADYLSKLQQQATKRGAELEAKRESAQRKYYFSHTGPNSEIHAAWEALKAAETELRKETGSE